MAEADDPKDVPAEVWLAYERQAKDVMNLWAPGVPALQNAVHAAMIRAWRSGRAVAVDAAVAPSSEDAGLDAGINYAIERLCEVLGVDPRSISWDAATETMDGDVCSVICNVLRAAYGEEWSAKPSDTARIRSALTPSPPDSAA